jgi:hypothetical protein
MWAKLLLLTRYGKGDVGGDVTGSGFLSVHSLLQTKMPRKQQEKRKKGGEPQSNLWPVGQADRQLKFSSCCPEAALPSRWPVSGSFTTGPDDPRRVCRFL